MAMTNIRYSYRVNDAANPIAVQDGLTSLLTGLGGNMDPSRSSFYTPPMLSREQIDNSYRTSWLSAAIHDAIPMDMTRAWRQFDVDDDTNSLIRNEERRHGVMQKTLRCETLARLYGGSVMMMGVRNDDPREELDVKTIKKGDLKYLHAISCNDISVPSIMLDPGSSRYGEPTSYNINAGNGVYAEIHPSRIIRFLSKEMPEHIAIANRSFGDPILYAINQAIMDADTAQASFSALTAKARTDTVTIPNLIELASTQVGEDKLKQRIQIMKAFESIFSTRILAGGRTATDPKEEWGQFQVVWQGMPEMQQMFWQAVAGASGVPLTRLVGMSPSGLNATGQSDTDGYYELISARQEMSLRPRLEMLDEVLLRSATGSRNEDWYFTFNPLAVDSATVKATNSKTRADALKSLADSGSVPSEVLSKLARGQIIESGDYPGADEAYDEYQADGNVLGIEEPEAPTAANDNPVLAAATEGLAASGKSASVAARDAAVMLADARPMTLYISRKVENFAAIREWYEGQGVRVTVPDDKAHVTIAHSSTPIDWMTVSPDDYRDPVLKLPEGGARIMEKFGQDGGTLVQLFSSSQLSWRHEEILRAGATWDWPSFEPHYSLDYDAAGVSVGGIKPWLGEIVLGPERFEQIVEDWSANVDQE